MIAANREGIRMGVIQEMIVRNGRPSDHEKIVALMPEWWGGRDLTSMLPKLFFSHFSNTIYIAELESQLVGFLVGFFSQSDASVGYIHFAGVHPNYRKAGIGRYLYQKFFDVCIQNNRTIIMSCTSPVNKLSIGFHLRMGFIIEPGDGVIDGVPVTMNYNRKHDSKVLFRKELDAR